MLIQIIGIIRRLFVSPFPLINDFDRNIKQTRLDRRCSVKQHETDAKIQTIVRPHHAYSVFTIEKEERERESCRSYRLSCCIIQTHFGLAILDYRVDFLIRSTSVFSINWTISGFSPQHHVQVLVISRFSPQPFIQVNFLHVKVPFQNSDPLLASLVFSFVQTLNSGALGFFVDDLFLSGIVICSCFGYIFCRLCSLPSK